MAKDLNAFGGFNELVGMITKVEEGPKAVIDDEKPSTIKLSKSVENGEDDEEHESVDLTPGKNVTGKQQVKDTIENEDTDGDAGDGEDSDNQESEEETKETKKTTEEDSSSTEAVGLGEVEPELSEYFANQLIDKLGVELKDAKFEKLDDVIDLMTQVIEANSVPTYASPEVEEYDKYLKNGGTSLKDFYDAVYKEGIDPARVDLEREEDQKLVIETNLKNLGYKEDRIKKVISRYEDAEVLKDEAVDALENIKDFQSKKAKTLLADQEKEAVEANKRNQQFVDSVVKYVDGLKDIQGMQLDSKKKSEIVDYIFRVTPDGSTQFQKAYASDVVKNLVGSAVSLKYGDTLLTNNTKKATDAALNKVRDKLKASKGKRNTGSGSSQGLGKTSPNLSTLSSLIIK
jgi:hypothetical protein